MHEKYITFSDFLTSFDIFLWRGQIQNRPTEKKAIPSL